MNFSRFLDIQSWWEVPSIAYFCSLFRTAFNLLDFDIEELEEALLTDGSEETASSLLTELIVRLLNGCLGNNDISAFNYQMYLRRLFRQKCQETHRYNPFNTDIDFQFLPLRTKVEILYALCDFRLDADDVYDLFKNLEAESLRVEPLGWDDNDSAYWYFYGTRLYREDVLKKRGRSKKRKRESRKRGWFYGDDWLEDEDSERVWQVVCFTEEDWTHLTEKFKNATSKIEKELYRSLSQNFLPEIPRLFQEKERLQRKRLLELAPRRTSSRVLQKVKQKQEIKNRVYDSRDEDSKETPQAARESRARRRDRLRRSKSPSPSSDPSSDSSSDREVMPQKVTRKSRTKERKSKKSSSTHKGEPPPEPVVRTGRKTNNSLAAATGQIVIPDNDEPVNSTRRKVKTSQIFGQTEEDIQTDMYKVLEQLTAHEDAWPFLDPVEEEYAPNYYAVIRRPMDLHKMEERLDNGYYSDFSMFKADFKLIVNNCRLYNGQENEYTIMVDSLQNAFDRLTEKYIHRLSSSDEEIAVEYQLPTPSRKHKIKRNDSPPQHQAKKRKSHSVAGAAEPKSSSSTSKQSKVQREADEGDGEKRKERKERKSKEPPQEEEEEEEEEQEAAPKEVEKSKESHKSKHEKGKKKRKGHHRHGKHSKNHKKNSHKSHESRKHRKQKHGKNKDKKSKKKKSKHHDEEPPEVMKRSESQESIESSNRSRSASPLPSIHTPSPSPTELDKSESNDQLPDPDFTKDKYDKIKERRRHAAKDAWDSLFDYKQKVEKQKHSSHAPEKEKNRKLRETIEKLKAKNEKYKDTTLYNNIYKPGRSNSAPNYKERAKVRRDVEESDDDEDEEDDNDEDEPEEDVDDDDDDDDDVVEMYEDDDESVESVKVRPKRRKRSSVKNACASEALEEAVKDINEWLSDAPKSSKVISPCDSPAQTVSTEDSSRMDDESSQGEKSITSKRDTSRKRPSSREPKVVKRREIQRTIDRLQPGKSKGNLLTNKSNKNSDKTEEEAPSGPSKSNHSSRKNKEATSPKLSLGSVLHTVEFTLGNDHNFNNNNAKGDKNKETKKVVESKDIKKPEPAIENKLEETPTYPTKKDAEVETEPQTIIKPSQEKATPNLSAWFKAFGTPKTTTVNIAKKKDDKIETEEKTTDATSLNAHIETKTSPKTAAPKYESPNTSNSPLPEGGDSPLPNVTATPRQRRTSTGSTISERSSFSQDLDSPRHQMSLTSPLIHSPASPRTDDFQKITYPIINGTVRAGFYQDTTSLKSSPDKSCSPRDAPQSPYSPYNSHVYASNNATGSSTPNYFVDHSKSPLPTYGQNAPPYYDTSKAPVVSKPVRVHDDYTALGPDSFQQPQYNAPFSPTPSQYSPVQTNYSQPLVSPQPEASTSQQPPTVPILPDPKPTLFPVKKRTYNEPENLMPPNKPEVKEIIKSPVKNDYSKTQAIQSTVHAPTSVDDIALALSEKSEILKSNTIRETNVTLDYSDRRNSETREPISYENNESREQKDMITHIDLTKPVNASKKDNIDMINMGYLNNEDRKIANDSHDVEFISRETRPNLIPQQKGYEIEAIAINLGINNQQVTKPSSKSGVITSNMTPAHSHPPERAHAALSPRHGAQAIPHAHHNHYDAMPPSHAVPQLNTFSLNDIELANKKLYACSAAAPTATPSAIDYGNWKVNSVRKSDMIPSDYSATSYASEDKLKPIDTAPAAAINYNKNIQHQQYNNYNTAPRPVVPRAQDLPQNLPAELRIPNPRGLIKNDSVGPSTSINDSDIIAKNMESITKSQKMEKLAQNHPLVSSLPYKTPYSTHSTIPIETLRSLQNIPQMLERYTNDERYLSSFVNTTPSLYHDKTYQMFNKNMASEAHPASTSVSPLYSQPAIATMSKDNTIYKSTANVASTPTDVKRGKKKRTSDVKQSSAQIGQPYHAAASDVLTSAKTTMIPASPFNFGTASTMSLGGMYGDNGGFTIEDIRNSTNQLMAANYMAAAVAHQHRSNETSTGKLAKAAHPNANDSTGSFPFIGHSQVRAGYGYLPAEQSSPLYQQYWQRYQEELQRQTAGAQIMGLYPGAYSAPLGVRQTYDSINRPSWL